MDWDNVRVFLAVARGGQFVAAGKRLKLDHATVSRRIAALEATVGAKLFDRRTTGAKLTGAGERFISAAEQMESAFLHAQGEISGVDLELTGDVRIGAPDGFSTYYLVGALRDFAERHPGVRLQLMPLPQLTPLARREVDVVIGLDKPEAGRFVARKLTDYSLGIYASASYLKRNGAPADVEALKGHRLIGYVEEHAFSSALDYVRELYRRRADQLRKRERGHPARGGARRASAWASCTTSSPAASRTSNASCPSDARRAPIGSSRTRTLEVWGASAPSPSIWRKRSRGIGQFFSEMRRHASTFVLGSRKATSRRTLDCGRSTRERPPLQKITPARPRGSPVRRSP